MANEGLTLTRISASEFPAGKTVFEYKVNENHVNGMGNFHGGCCATIFDWTTTTALIPISRPGFWISLGVSRTLSVTCLRLIPKDEIVIIENGVVHAGRRLCMIPSPILNE
jgi:acyl-coenzyme A thioesterase 13